jgi:hypothetical protein
VLAPELRPSDVAILDDLAGHKSEATAELLAARSSRMPFLRPYSPDLNDRNAVRLAQYAAAQGERRSRATLGQTIGNHIAAFAPHRCAIYIRRPGYSSRMTQHNRWSGPSQIRCEGPAHADSLAGRV